MSPVRNGAVDVGLPLRCSARAGDEHFNRHAGRLRIDVFLDGALIPRVVSYDVIAGEIVRHRRDGLGRLIPSEFETLRGCVEVRFAGRRRSETDPAKLNERAEP